MSGFSTNHISGVTASSDGIIFSNPLGLPSYTVAQLLAGTPSAATRAGLLVWCSDDITGAQVVCSDGISAGGWHRGINATNALVST